MCFIKCILNDNLSATVLHGNCNMNLLVSAEMVDRSIIA